MAILRRGRTACAAAALAALTAPASAPAATVSFTQQNVLVFQAAPGEANALMITRSEADYECGELMPACVILSESVVPITSFPASRCMRQTEQAGTIECVVPASVVANLGDREDSMWDWDGPSVVNAGDGNDATIHGFGGDDRLNGDAGSDNLAGDGGDDVLDGGAGDDIFEGSGSSGPVTGGADTYIGGAGNDLLDYDGRTEDLSITLDENADDGAAGEGDRVGGDVERVHAGAGDDVMVGNGGRNELEGRDGDDEIHGGGAEDTVLGDAGADRVFGEDGQDIVAGGDGDDHVDGGAAVDQLSGDDTFCVPSDCPTGADRIEARDGTDELVRCGPGDDLAVLDPQDTIVTGEIDRCERVDVGTAPTDPPGSGACGTCAPPQSPPRPGTCSACPPPPPARPCAPACRDAADTVRPAIRGLVVGPLRARRGTTIRFSLSEAAAVTLRFERRVRRAGRTRYARLRGRLTHAGRAGANALAFAGRVGGRRLAPGRYRVVATARDVAGNASSARATLVVRAAGRT